MSNISLRKSNVFHLLSPMNLPHASSNPISLTCAGCSFPIPKITNIHGAITTLCSTYVTCLCTNASDHIPILTSHSHIRHVPSLTHTLRHATTSLPLLRMSLYPFLAHLRQRLSLTSTAATNGSTRVVSAS